MKLTSGRKLNRTVKLIFFQHLVPIIGDILKSFLHQSAEVIKGQQMALVLSGRDNAVQLQLRRHNIFGLGALTAHVCSQPDTQFHSVKHEIDSQDQMQSVCNWKCMGQGVNELTGGYLWWFFTFICMCEGQLVGISHKCASSSALRLMGKTVGGVAGRGESPSPDGFPAYAFRMSGWRDKCYLEQL